MSFTPTRTIVIQWKEQRMCSVRKLQIRTLFCGLLHVYVSHSPISQLAHVKYQYETRSFAFVSSLTIGTMTLNSRHVFTRTFWGVHIDVIKPQCALCSVHVQYNTKKTETDLFYGVNLRDGYIFAKSPSIRSESSAKFDVDSFDFPSVEIGGLQRSQVQIEMQWTSLNTPFRFEVIESALSEEEAKMFTYCSDTLH
ncbi:hypothetical protein M3Y98_00651100 [Aphelenchoides besseyi]|nr:hypothetical protein M3Y98_00651100 [Aphelenchoides besseyi]